MNDSLFFVNPAFEGWLIAVLVVPLFTFLIWKEVKRNHKFLLYRVIAQGLVLISILGLLLKPGYVQEINSAGYILLTQSYKETEVDSLLSKQPGLGILHLPQVGPYRDSRPLASYQDLADFDNEILFVIGEGIPRYALDLMDVKKFKFIGSQKPIGIVQLDLQEHFSAHQVNRISGLVNSRGDAMLTLIGPGGEEDSVVVKKNGIESFSLKFKPKHPGLFTYTLQYKDDSGIQSEQFPVIVPEEHKLDILFLQKFPSFEIRQLKNFLAENGHRLALRYQVSKNNYRVEFANVQSIRTSPLTTSILREFDLVVVDGDGLESLNASEKNILEESVHEGLGLIILANTTIENDKLRQRFLPIEMKRSVKDTVFMTLSSRPYMLPVLTLQVIENASVYPVTKKGDRILSAYCYKGFGKTGMQLLRETYRIALEGNIDGYAGIWSPLIEKTARKKDEQVKIKINNSFPVYQDEPVVVEIISSGESVAAKNDREAIPLIEHVAIDNLWWGKTWAGTPGWHRLSVDSTLLHYFVSDSLAWRALRVNNQLKENYLASTKASASARPDIFYQRKSISTMIFYMLFLVAAGFLWLAPKI
jgi:hypothetical protein